MDEPVEPPFTPTQPRVKESSLSGGGEKLIIEMPFNNDITFPVPMVPGETVGDLRRRIATTIGVDSSRVLVSQTSPALPSDVSVKAAAEGNKLQLVVRSAFDFEKLRQLIEADRYSPIHPPELSTKKAMPSPLNSPEIGHGFPFRSSASLVSPRRPRPRRVLRIKLHSGATVEFDTPQDFHIANNTLLVSPDLDAKLKEVGIGKDELTTQQQLVSLINLLLRNALSQYRDLRARGLHQLLGICFLVLLIVSSNKVPQWIGMVILACLFLGFYWTHYLDIDLVAFARLPPVYAEYQDVRDLIPKIPAQYKNNEDTSEQMRKEICNTMRIRCGWFGVVKILLVSLFPTMYETWVQQVVRREDAHHAAIKIAAEINIKERQEREAEAEAKAEEELNTAATSSDSAAPTPTPTTTTHAHDPATHPAAGSPFREFSGRRNQDQFSPQSYNDTAFSTGSEQQHPEPDRNPFSSHNLGGQSH